jgi:hypothetical protein
MFRKIWEALALIVLLVLLMHVALASLRPFMPALGLIMCAGIAYSVYKVLNRRRW